MFHAFTARRLFRQNTATVYLEGVAIGVIAVALPIRRRSLFGGVSA